MAAVTTHYGNAPSAKAKPFAWSYSKLKNFESCPKRHFHIDIEKSVKEDESETLTWGNEVHKHLANRISRGKALPESMAPYEGWAKRIVTGEGNILVEQKLAISADFGACEFFAKDAWYRGIGDVIKVVGDLALIIDWKTGKILEDSQQLALMAACVFAHHPQVAHVRSEFVWLAHNANTTETFARAEMAPMWRNLWPRIEALERAHVTASYPAKPGRLCRLWCPVKKCPHHGESN